MTEDDDENECRYDERIRLIDAGAHGLVTMRFILAGDPKVWDTDEHNHLIVHLAQQFDLVTSQLMAQFGFDCAADPGLLWRATSLDMGDGDWTIRKPLGWSLTYSDGHEEGSTLWNGKSADGRWEMELERSGWRPGKEKAAAERQKVRDWALDFARSRLPLVAAPSVTEEGNATIVKVAFRGEGVLDLVRRWYIVREQDDCVVLKRITFGCRAADADSIAGNAMADFFEAWVEIAANNRFEPSDAPEHEAESSEPA